MTQEQEQEQKQKQDTLPPGRAKSQKFAGASKIQKRGEGGKVKTENDS